MFTHRQHFAFAALAAVTLAACATTQSVGTQIDDSTLTARVGTRLAADPDVRRYQIDVDTLNGVVTLRGEVDNAQAEAQALQVARNTEGVASVVDRLDVVAEDADDNANDDNKDDQAEGDSTPDGMLTMRVRNKLVSDPQVKAVNIDVDSQNGVVTLSGVVENATSRSEAERLARETDGVVQVVNELTLADASAAAGKPN